MGRRDRYLVFTTLDILLTLLNHAFCLRMLIYMDYINSLPMPSGVCLGSASRVPCQKIKEKESEVRVFLSLTLSLQGLLKMALSSDQKVPLLSKLYIFSYWVSSGDFFLPIFFWVTASWLLTLSSGTILPLPL